MFPSCLLCVIINNLAYEFSYDKIEVVFEAREIFFASALSSKIKWIYE